MGAATEPRLFRVKPADGMNMLPAAARAAALAAAALAAAALASAFSRARALVLFRLHFVHSVLPSRRSLEH